MALNSIEADDASIDLLQGAAEIAEFVFGDRNERRKVYHLAAIGEIPVFRMGSILYARKSTLLAAIAEREDQSLQIARTGKASSKSA